MTASTAHAHPFVVWRDERARIEGELDRTPEATQAKAREQLFDKLFAIEQQILNTNCLDPPAIRIKADLLVWYMEMEQADGLAAMRHIQAYLAREASRS